MDNRRLFLAALLSLGVLILWGVFFPAPKPPAPTPATSAPAAPLESTQASSHAPAALSGATSAPAVGTAEPVAAAANLPPVAAAGEERSIVETAQFRAEFTNRGAQLASFQLKGQGKEKTATLELVKLRERWPLPFALTTGEGKPLPINDALFALEDSTAEGARTLSFRYSGPLGQAEKVFRFDQGPLFDLEVHAPQPAEWGVVLGPGMRNIDSGEMKNRFARRAAVYKEGEEVQVVDAQGAGADVLLPGVGLRWIGIEDTYFLTVLVPSTPIKQALLRPVLVEPPATEGAARFSPVPPKDEITSAQKSLARELEVIVVAGSEGLKAQAYFGPKQFALLEKLPHGLEKTIAFGYFGFIARPLLLGLIWIHDHVVANYGWAIVLMTLALKILLLPLTHKSYVSMKKMQELNPRMQAIRERWRPKLKDRQGKSNLDAQRKMQEEINALFRSEGVNPAGGCLPMLLQLPLLWAFYNLLSTAFELRGAPWILWIKDLSVADPYYVLPIIMGVTQLVQQRMTPQTGDAMQRRLFQLMPIFFTVLFLGFPSGLVLYWLVNNVLTIAQQGGYNYLQERKKQAAAA